MNNCTNLFFGIDPLFGIVKSCEAFQGSTPGTRSVVATEWQPFTLERARRVRYGANDAWIEVDLPAGVHRCTNEYFGVDPLFGTVKACETVDIDSPPSSSVWILASVEYESFTLTSPTRVRYGYGSTWIERSLPAGTYPCSNAFFGKDPLVGVVKRCEMLASIFAGSVQLSAISPAAPQHGEVGGVGDVRRFRVTNSGTTSATISVIRTDGEFAVVAPAAGECREGAPLPGGQSCDISVALSAASMGLKAGQLTVSGNFVASPESLPSTSRRYA